MPEVKLAPETMGRHNLSIDAATRRVLNTGSWKKQRIICIVPGGGNGICMEVYQTHKNLSYPPNQPHIDLPTADTEVGEAYSQTIAQILAHPELSQWEYILTLEHDNGPPQDGVIELLKRFEQVGNQGYAAISGLYWTKGEGGVPQIWGSPADPQLNFRPQPPVDGQLVECNGIGMGFALWRLEVFKDPRLRRPWFKTQSGKEGMGTQDLYFCADARQHGYRFGVDCAVKVGHFDKQGQYGPPGTWW